MLRSRLTPVAALLALALPVAHGEDPKPPATPLERIEAVHKELNEKIATLQRDVAALKDQARRLETANSSQSVLLDSWEMRNQLDLLQAEVRRLRDQLAAAEGGASTSEYRRLPAGPGGRRESYRMDGGGGLPPRESLRLANLGTVRVVNRSAFDREFLLNGRVQVVAAGATANIDVPAGPFNYQIVGLTIPTVSDVPPGMVRTININW